MEEYVLKKDALAAICRDCDSPHTEQRELCPYKFTGCTAYYNVFDIPAADVVERKKGQWLHEELIPNDVDGHVFGECSVCHAVRIVDNYCPNCGSDMRGECDEKEPAY